MRQYLNYEGESIYIAGPACFYHNGYTLWHALRGIAEYYGFKVMIPTTRPLKLDNEDLRKNADEIFRDCAYAMNNSTAIIGDLESFRGTEPDGGTLYEIGMAYAAGHRLYAYTRDKRPLVHKLRTANILDDKVVGEFGNLLDYPELPFCPCLFSTTKIVEGKFEDALQLLMIDVDQEKKEKAWPQKNDVEKEKYIEEENSIFLFSPKVYNKESISWFEEQKIKFKEKGYNMYSPFDVVEFEPEYDDSDPILRAIHLAERWFRLVQKCQAFVVDLNDYNGYEPSGDSSFLAGYAWQLNKKCVGFMDDIRKMRDRIPHFGEDKENKDQYGNEVENFDYPINLMFASSMPIVKSKTEKTIEEIVEYLEK